MTAADAITPTSCPTLQHLSVGSGPNFSTNRKVAITNAWILQIAR
jgi:hypothetical protein